jgi:GTP-binding protein HflX
METEFDPTFENDEDPLHDTLGQTTALLVGIDINRHDDPEDSLLELGRLCDTLGIVVATTHTFKLRRRRANTLVGTGQLQMLKELIEEHPTVNLVIFDIELSPFQTNTLNDELPVAVLDRPQLIMEIFASHARTREGKMQIELARLVYSLPRQRGMGLVLSRLGGGIGTRGPGETKLEIKRRTIREQIRRLKKEIKTMAGERDRKRKSRKSLPLPVVSLVGYTNAGKSTLLNQLTGSDILVEDKLFSTLDPTTRKIILPSNQRLLLSDTVGFIQRLPHHLIDAFRSTLEEASWSDLLLHVIDATDTQWRQRIEIVDQILSDIGCGDHPRLRLLNKCDALTPLEVSQLPGDFIPISARTGIGMDKLIITIEETLNSDRFTCNLKIPRVAGEIFPIIYRHAQIIEQTDHDDYVLIKLQIDNRFKGKMKPYMLAD